MSELFMSYRGTGYIEANRAMSDKFTKDHVDVFFDEDNCALAFKETDSETNSYKLTPERKGSKIKRIRISTALSKLGKEIKKGKYPVKKYKDMWVIDLEETK